MTPPKDSKDWLAATLDEHAALYADTTMKYITEEMSEEERDKEWHHSDLKTKHAIESHYTKELEKADVRETKALEERDALEDKLDSLSEAVAAYFKVDIGEHSNVNDPVYNAFQLLRDNTRIDQVDRERD